MAWYLIIEQEDEMNPETNGSLCQRGLNSRLVKGLKHFTREQTRSNVPLTLSHGFLKCTRSHVSDIGVDSHMFRRWKWLSCETDIKYSWKRKQRKRPYPLTLRACALISAAGWESWHGLPEDSLSFNLSQHEFPPCSLSPKSQVQPGKGAPFTEASFKCSDNYMIII